LEDSKGYLTVFKGCLVTLKGFLWFWRDIWRFPRLFKGFHDFSKVSGDLLRSFFYSNDQLKLVVDFQRISVDFPDTSTTPLAFPVFRDQSPISTTSAAESPSSFASPH
jgi:hypothetical protein